MRIGALISGSGPAGIWGPSSIACAMLANAELNAAGGLFGEPVELIVADPGWTTREAAEASGRLVEVDAVDAVIDMHPSNVRQAVKRRLRGAVPYIYTPQYEGGESTPGTVAI